MSKRIWGMGLAVLLALPGVVSATLIDRGSGLIYDDALDITWLQDANYAKTSGFDADGRMAWSAANAWAAGLSYLDSVRGVTYSDWRLPNMDVNGDNTIVNCSAGSVTGCSDNEMGYLFWEEGITAVMPIPFTNVQSLVYWSGTEFAPSTSSAWFFNFRSGNQGSANKGFNFFAWAVRSGDVAASSAPEPSTIILLGLGLAGIGFNKRRKRRL